MSNAYNLLVETPSYDLSYLVEEKNRNAPSNMSFYGPFLMANKPNRNNRVYPLQQMVEEVNRYSSEMIVNKRSTGELNHPTSPDVNLERACHMVTELKQDGDIFMGKSKVLSTPMGQVVRSLMLDGVKLGVSSRALGRVESEKGYNKVTDFRLVAIDVVADPSVPTAFVNGILESKQWVLADDGKFEPFYEKLENQIAKLPRHNKDQYLKECIIGFINLLKTA
jgi:Prohead core protein serine protease